MSSYHIPKQQKLMPITLNKCSNCSTDETVWHIFFFMDLIYNSRPKLPPLSEHLDSGVDDFREHATMLSLHMPRAHPKTRVLPSVP